MAEENSIIENAFGQQRRIAVLGGGSWATAIAKIFLEKEDSILWYMRRDDRIADFKTLEHNPAYLTDVQFDINRIEFTSDINYAVREADVLVLVIPSPYLVSHFNKITEDLSGKILLNATKGMVPEKNMTISEYCQKCFNISEDNFLVVSGPSHAEEIALERLTYLTIACRDESKSQYFADLMRNDYVVTSISTDVIGIEYSSVLKNIYAIAAGIYYGQRYGDNFHAVLISNAIREMERFLKAVAPNGQNVCDSVYLGDLLVTSYSNFSRNRVFGTMIGRGYSVKAAQVEMEMVVEGFYGAKCLHEINEQTLHLDLPIIETVYRILHKRHSGAKEFADLRMRFN